MEENSGEENYGNSLSEHERLIFSKQRQSISEKEVKASDQIHKATNQ